MHSYFRVLYLHRISILVSIFIIVIDQLTKILTSILLPLGTSWPNEGLLRLTHARNTGAAFSLFQDQTMILSLVSVVAVIFSIPFSILSNKNKVKDFFILFAGSLSIIIGIIILINNY